MSRKVDPQSRPGSIGREGDLPPFLPQGGGDGGKAKGADGVGTGKSADRGYGRGKERQKKYLQSRAEEEGKE